MEAILLHGHDRFILGDNRRSVAAELSRAGRDDEGTRMLLYALVGVSTLVIFLVLDTVWISMVALPNFRAAFGADLLFRAVPGILFYLLYLVGILCFVARPAIASGRWSTAIGYGALFGLVAYGTYDLTNYATLRSWSLALTVSDMAWGAFLTAVSSTLGLIVGTYLLSLIKPAG
jgi:uncharacterized membrane protein